MTLRPELLVAIPPTDQPLTDTSPEAERRLIDEYRRMSAQEKLEQVVRLSQAVQKLALIDLRRRFPDADDRELQLRLAARWLDPELMRSLVGWDPDEEVGDAH